MILNALYKYYSTLVSNSDSGISPVGYSKAKISFALEIAHDGTLMEIIDLRRVEGKKLLPREMDVPEAEKRSSNKLAQFLWDKSKYVLGIDYKKKVLITKTEFNMFKELHQNILNKVDDEGAKAVLAFLQGWEPENFMSNKIISNYIENLLTGGNIIFRLSGDTCFIHERSLIRKEWGKYKQDKSSEIFGQCLVTGEYSPIAKLHQNIKGVRGPGAQPSGAPLVTSDKEAFESYGKKQSFNAPVSEAAAFAYTTALNFMLSSERQHIKIGDSTMVFWAEKSSAGLEEDIFSKLLLPENLPETAAEGNAENTDYEATQLVYDILSRARKGKPVTDAMTKVNSGTRFYILGLSPNAGRVSVRFWNVDIFGLIIEKLIRHHMDMAIDKYKNDRQYISIKDILRETATLGEIKNASPLLEGSLLRTILQGTSYPQSLYTSIISRVRADSGPLKINSTRAGIIKACLLRNARIYGRKDLEAILTMSLNEQSTNTAYRLGRLFALLEKLQQDAASMEINATIKDRYFGAASASPAAVFPLLMRLSQHHMSKANSGFYIDKKVEEVLSSIEEFPAHLNLEEQGLFILGYYHQRQALYKKNERKEGENE